MRILLFVISVVMLLLGVLSLLISRNSIQETQGWVMLLIAAVALVGAAVVEAINGLRADLRAARETGPKP